MTTVKELIASLTELDPELEVFVSYDGGYIYSSDLSPYLSKGETLYRWRGHPDKSIVVIDV